MEAASEVDDPTRQSTGEDTPDEVTSPVEQPEAAELELHSEASTNSAVIHTLRRGDTCRQLDRTSVTEDCDYLRWFEVETPAGERG